MYFPVESPPSLSAEWVAAATLTAAQLYRIHKRHRKKTALSFFKALRNFGGYRRLLQMRRKRGSGNGGVFAFALILVGLLVWVMFKYTKPLLAWGFVGLIILLALAAWFTEKYQIG